MNIAIYSGRRRRPSRYGKRLRLAGICSALFFLILAMGEIAAIALRGEFTKARRFLKKTRS